MKAKQRSEERRRTAYVSSGEMEAASPILKGQDEGGWGSKWGGETLGDKGQSVHVCVCV